MHPPEQLDAQQLDRPFATAGHSGHARWVFFVLFYAILANIPFWAASHWLGLLPLGWFCLEYALVGLLALFLPRWLSAALLLLAVGVDLTAAAGKTYYLTPAECFANIPLLLELPESRLAALVVVTLLFFAAIAIAALMPVRKIRGTHRVCAAGCLAAFVVMGISIDCVAVARERGHIANPFAGVRPSDQNRYSTFANLWASRYPTIRLARNRQLFGAHGKTGTDTALASTSVASAMAIVLHDAGAGSSRTASLAPNIVLILFESWGVDLNPAVRNALLAPYSDPEILAHYRVLSGTVPFYGPTVAGEARELCGTRLGLGIMNASTSLLGHCLPDRLAALGYRNISAHGMDGYMFHRDVWYSNAGFQELWFHDQFRRQGLADCPGAFVGTCDAAIAQWIGDRLQKHQDAPSFLYWVTLNSHLPVPTPSPVKDGASCSLTPLLATEPALCSWYQLVANGHRAIAALARRDLPRPTIFVIVGDHAPPFSNAALRNRFSGTDVPFIALVPGNTPQHAALSQMNPQSSPAAYSSGTGATSSRSAAGNEARKAGSAARSGPAS